MRAALFVGLLLTTPAMADPVFMDAKVVDAADLAAGTSKYDGKTIELRGVRCYYADVGDYRCVTGASAVVFAAKIANDDGRKLIEEKCDAVKVALTSSTCRVNVRFVAGERSSDLIAGYERRVILKPDRIEVIAVASKRRQR